MELESGSLLPSSAYNAPSGKKPSLSYDWHAQRCEGGRELTLRFVGFSYNGELLVFPNPQRAGWSWVWSSGAQTPPGPQEQLRFGG